MGAGPIFLILAEVVAIHADQIARYGGALGVRDLGLLQSALAAALVFLELNGLTVHDPQQKLYPAMMSLAQGRSDKTTLAGLLEDLSS